MSQQVPKLNKLIISESFIQFNTIKGYQYIDKAGMIVNSLHRDSIPPNFRMSIEGLVVETPDNIMDELKISSNVLWAKFTKIDSLERIEHVYIKRAKEILKILEVEKLNRVGWRNYFIYEFKNDKEFKTYFEKLNPLLIEKSTITIITDFKLNDKNIRLGIQPVMKDDLKTKGVQFDLDITLDGEFNIESVENTLKDFLIYMKSEDFLELINQSFK